MIGIVGGLGPYAGLDLLKKTFDNTLANRDQDHLDTLLMSCPSRIEDRTEYLIGKSSENPALEIAEVIRSLHKSGATVVGIPCNTAHAQEIFDVILDELKKTGTDVKLLNMIEQSVKFIKKNYPNIKNVGVLSTTGTYKSRIYPSRLEDNDYRAIAPSEEIQKNLIHPAIYNRKYGIKACSNPIHPQAKENIIQGLDYLRGKGAQAVILACTELPLAFPEKEYKDIPLIDPTAILARSLIEQIDINKLKPL